VRAHGFYFFCVESVLVAAPRFSQEYSELIEAKLAAYREGFYNFTSFPTHNNNNNNNNNNNTLVSTRNSVAKSSGFVAGGRSAEYGDELLEKGARHYQRQLVAIQQRS
jgi:hypothetical protein